MLAEVYLLQRELQLVQILLLIKIVPRPLRSLDASPMNEEALPQCFSKMPQTWLYALPSQFFMILCHIMSIISKTSLQYPSFGKYLYLILSYYESSLKGTCKNRANSAASASISSSVSGCPNLVKGTPRLPFICI